MEDDRGHTHDLAAGHHGEACRVPPTVGHHPEHHRDEAGEEVTAGEIVRRGEEAAAVEAGDGEVPVIAPMAATAVGVEIADKRCGLFATVFCKGLVASAWSCRSAIRIFVWPEQRQPVIETVSRVPIGPSSYSAS
jgi:hypothetical protein